MTFTSKRKASDQSTTSQKKRKTSETTSTTAKSTKSFTSAQSRSPSVEIIEDEDHNATTRSGPPKRPGRILEAADGSDDDEDDVAVEEPEESAEAELGRILLSHIRNRLSVQSTRALLCLGTWSLMGFVQDSDVKAGVILPEVEEENENDVEE
ncbi:hypothetical protein H0H81_003202, partial [Sphagnurus paluster]